LYSPTVYMVAPPPRMEPLLNSVIHEKMPATTTKVAMARNFRFCGVKTPTVPPFCFMLTAGLAGVCGGGGV
jgi:branched-subunit amino acid ABC-type transport system permease component